MALLKLFGAEPRENVEMKPVFTEDTHVENKEEGIKSSEEKQDEKQMITITWGTGLPIDVIFNFIHKNFEEEGFQDALVNQDITYRDAKEKIIRNDLKMLFKRIILRYNDDIREINVMIDNAQKSYALAASGRLMAQRETFEEHLAEINEMRQQFENGDPEMLTMIESYRRGFLKGMTAVSTNFIKNK